MLILKTASCPALGNWAKEQDVWYSYKTTPQPGDLVLFDFSGKHSSRDHVGIVKSVSGSTFISIEGNTGTSNNANGGAVMERQRTVSQVVGWIHPRYTSTQTAKKLLNIAQGQVGITEWPANSNKVKYNTWYYGKEVSGSAYPWCAVFVCWCFAVLAGEIKNDGSAKKLATCAVNVPLDLVDGRHEVGEGEILSLQAILRAKGFKGKDGKDLALDGEWGTNTEYALKTAQKAAGITADGQCGAVSWAKIIKMEVK